jgi:hypothetical protein
MGASACFPQQGTGPAGFRPNGDGAAAETGASTDGPATSEDTGSGADTGAIDTGGGADVRDAAVGDRGGTDLRDVGRDATGSETGSFGIDGGRVCTGGAGSCICSLSEPDPGATPVTCDLTFVSGSADEQAACCRGSFSCRCTSYACRQDSATMVCSCAATYLLDRNDMQVASCTAGAGRRCCLSESLTQCDCLPSSCAEGDTEVPSCSPADVANCAEVEAPVTVCN